MTYVVKSLEGGMRLVFRDNGIVVERFDSVAEAKLVAVSVGMSFEVVEAEMPFRRMCSGIKSPVGFLMEECCANDVVKGVASDTERERPAVGLQA